MPSARPAAYGPQRAQLAVQMQGWLKTHMVVAAELQRQGIQGRDAVEESRICCA